ncbi:MAG: glycosyl hydrolase, partial [Planctomycetota bacterium]
MPEAMPESRGKSLSIREDKQAPELSEEIIAVYRLSGKEYENVTESIRSGEKLPEGRYLVAFIQMMPSSPWFGGKYYVDLLKPGVTEKFLDITMEAYRREIGKEFGKRVPGVFTDEPHIAPHWDNHWTEDMPEMFKKRWGYSLIEHLPSIFMPVGEWKRVRHNYHQVLLELFIKCWARPYYEYCEKHGLEFTGHYWEHEWPKCNMAPDNMAMYAWQQRPGIDTLMNQYSEDTHSQFGNIRAVKELSSVANQLGRKRTLCEAYGAGGWELRLEDMKRIGDWLYVLGINTLNEHLSYVSIRGARKRDHPQSFSYHEPWWEAYHTISSYFTRLSAALSQGEEVNKILVIEPTTTVWMYQPDPNHKKELERIGSEFQQIVVALAKAQVEYDIGCENIIALHGSTKGDMLIVGQRQYSTIVLPPLMENVNAKTMDLIEAYTKDGGKVLCCGEPPTLVDGQPSGRGKAASQSRGWEQVEPEAVAGVLQDSSKDKFAIQASQDDAGILLHHRRCLDDGEILFLVNTSIESGSSGKIESAMGSVEEWGLETGNILPYPFEKNDNGIKIDFELAPCGSQLLFLFKEMGTATTPEPTSTSTLTATGPVKVRRIKPNVLTLDYVDVTVGGETRENAYFYLASQMPFRKNGMERNPWDSAVQFKDELITKKFSPDSGFVAKYRFIIEGKAPSSLYFVIERPDLYTISCNGRPISASEGIWWLDRSFGKIDITQVVKTGENTVTIKA